MNTSGIDLVLRSIDLSLNRRKLTLALVGTVASVIGSGIFVWLGQQLGDSPGLSLLFGLMGLLVAWVIISLFAGAITRLSYGDLAGWPSHSLSAALLDALQRLPSLLFAPLLIGLAWVAVILVEALLMLLGRIPYLGELVVAVLFLPAVLLNALMFVLLLTGAWLVFPVAMGENAGVTQTLRRVINVARSAPGRILTYLGITVVLSLLVTAVLVLLAFGAYVLTLTLTVTGMSAQRAMQMGLSNLMGMLSPLMGPMGGLMGLGSLFYGGGLFGGTRAAPPITMNIAGALIGLETLVLWLGSTWAVPWVFNLTASCAVFQSVAGSTSAPQPQPAHAVQPAAWSPAPQSYAPQPTYAPPPSPIRAPTLPAQSPYASPPAQPVVPPRAYSPPPAQPPYTPPREEPPTLAPPPRPPVVTPPAPRVCRSCGRPLANPNSRFCQSCGTRQF